MTLDFGPFPRENKQTTHGALARTGIQMTTPLAHSDIDTCPSSHRAVIIIIAIPVGPCCNDMREGLLFFFVLCSFSATHFCYFHTDIDREKRWHQQPNLPAKATSGPCTDPVRTNICFWDRVALYGMSLFRHHVLPVFGKVQLHRECGVQTDFRRLRPYKCTQWQKCSR